jgi:RND family efflux transporter MFP subunit
MREKLKRPLFIVIAMSFFVLVLLLLDEESATTNDISIKSPSLPKVSFVAVKAGMHESSVVVYGELKPKWDVILKAQVSGSINYINPVFESGSLVTENTVLMRIEDTPYQSQKSTAGVALAEAKLQLLQARNKTEITKNNWEKVGVNQTPSDLALFKPQLKIAEKALESAQQNFRAADNNLSYTRVKTPFKGIVIKRMVGLGQQIVEGEPLLQLIDHKNLYLNVFLSEIQWKNLSAQWLNSQAKLYSSAGEAIAMATIVSGGHYLDSETRQYPLSITVNSKENQSAFSGQFVEVRLEGKKLNNYLRLPESALTREGIVWFIDQQDTLRSYQPKSIHYQNKHVLVPLPDKSEYLAYKVWQVATVPLASFLVGKKVELTEVKVGN